MIRYIHPKHGGFWDEFLKAKFIKFMQRYPDIQFTIETGERHAIHYDTPREYRCVREWSYRKDGNERLWICEALARIYSYGALENY